MPSQELLGIDYNPLGRKVKAAGSWSTDCGDEYVDQIKRGAKLYFSIRIDFTSKEEKQEFEGHFSLSHPLGAAALALAAASQQFAKDINVRVTAFQIGGDESKVSQIFGRDANARATFVDCSFGALEKCKDVITNAITYAADTDNGFPSQMGSGHNMGTGPNFDMEYHTAPYPTTMYRHDELLTRLVIDARKRLSDLFEKEFAAHVLASRLLGTPFGEQRHAQIVEQSAIIDANIARLRSAFADCYDVKGQCVDAVASLKLGSWDANVISFPPAPRGAVHLYSTSHRLFSRQESVQHMTSFRFSSDSLSGKKANGDDLSVVLRISGVGVKRADLMFEDRILQTFDLTANAKFPEKVFDDGALLVLDTTRASPGWLDISLPDVENQLIRGSSQSDGQLFVRVTDKFDRQTDIGIVNLAWRTISSKGPTTTTPCRGPLNKVNCPNPDDRWDDILVQEWFDWWSDASAGVRPDLRVSTLASRERRWERLTFSQQWGMRNEGPVFIVLPANTECKNIAVDGLWSPWDAPHPIDSACSAYPGTLIVGPSNVALSGDYDKGNYRDNQGACTYKFECLKVRY